MAAFHESNLGPTPLRDLGLRIEGSPLEPILREFLDELQTAGIHRLRPRVYLSTEWGVPEGTIALAIPFYLARPDLTAVHLDRAGHVEGIGRADILRYLRHEMGHVINYAYRLFDDPGWVEQFGEIDQPYEEHYRPEPFSRSFVRHLPGWYAQKHPDEDWSETFAVWMTPGLDWRSDYAEWPVAKAKLQYCDRIMAALADLDPLITADDLDEDVGDLDYSLDHFYGAGPDEPPCPFSPDLDGPLRATFEGLGELPEGIEHSLASSLIRQVEPDLCRDIYQWTGHFPEHTRHLLRHLATRADTLLLVYHPNRQTSAIVALSCLITALAMNHGRHGHYLP